MPDLSAMTEEEQLHYALQMSMASSATTSTTGTEKQTPIDAEMKDVSEKEIIRNQNYDLIKKIYINNRKMKIMQKQ
jgi:hypothetical protein